MVKETASEVATAVKAAMTESREKTGTPSTETMYAPMYLQRMLRMRVAEVLATMPER